MSAGPHSTGPSSASQVSDLVEPTRIVAPIAESNGHIPSSPYNSTNDEVSVAMAMHRPGVDSVNSRDAELESVNTC